MLSLKGSAGGLDIEKAKRRYNCAIRSRYGALSQEVWFNFLWTVCGSWDGCWRMADFRWVMKAAGSWHERECLYGARFELWMDEGFEDGESRIARLAVIHINGQSNTEVIYDIVVFQWLR